MEYFKQEDAEFFAGDFPFHISRQGGDGECIGLWFHWHEFIEILYCDTGYVLVTIDNVNYTMVPGDMVLIGPNVVHTTYKKEHDTGSLYNILCSASVIQSVTASSLENRCIGSFLNYLSSFNYHYIDAGKVPPGMHELMKKMTKSYCSGGDFDCLYIRAYLLEMIGKLCEYGFFSVQQNSLNRQTLDVINRTVEYIQSHCDEKITLADMAQRANLSYHYYSKLFKQVTGKNFAAYLASARVFMAEKLMMEGEYSLQEIGSKVGLYPQSNFNHTYKRLRGFSPNEFVKRLSVTE